MKQLNLTIFALLFLAASAMAQSARLQVIHNAPNPTVDIYVNGILAFDDVAFRTATPFSTVPAGIPLSIAVAPGTSTSVADAIATFPVTFEADKTYAVTASGIVGDLTTPFTLIADDKAQEFAGDPLKVDLNVLHGAPDAPAIDVVVRTGAKIVSNLSYGQFTPYLRVDPAVYYLDIKPAGTNTIVATYKADLTGQAGHALRIFASGFLGGGAPAFGLFAALGNDGSVIELPQTAVARLQVIHNSPSPSVDIYADTTLLYDDLAFRTAKPFIFVPAEQSINIGVALDTSTSSTSAFANFPVTFENGKTYVVMAAGLLGSPTAPFTLQVNDGAREVASNSANVDVTVWHSAPGAPNVDVDATFVADNLVANLAYGSFTPYLNLAPITYDLAVRAAGDANVVASYRANLTPLVNKAVTVFASGFLSGTPNFGLFAALADGTVVPLGITPTARLQIIHNAPDPTVDVYVDNMRVLDDFNFRTATPFLTIPADRALSVGVAAGTSVSVNDVIFPIPVTLEAGKTYAAFASGIPFNSATPFTILLDEARESSSTPGKVEFATLHGAPGAPNVDVAVVGVGTIISNLTYTEFAPYIAVDPANYQIQVKVAASGAVVATYQVDLSTLGGGAARVFASGIVNGTPAFGLYAALPDGTVIEFPVAPPPPTTRVQLIHNAIAPTVDIYADGVLLLDDFSYRSATPFIDLPAGVAISIAVAPGTSTSVADALATFPVTFTENKKYIVTASGVLGDLLTPFTLIANDAAQESAVVPSKVDIAVLHGATNAPAIDIDAVFDANDIITNLAYGNFTAYLGLDPKVYDLTVRVAGTPNVVVTYRADLSGLTGGAAYVFASGLVNGTPGFGLFAALPNGTVVELPITPFSRVQVIHNSPSPTVDVYAGNTLLLDNFVFRTATPFVSIPADRDIVIGVALANSTSSSDTLVGFPVNFSSTKNYTVFANGIVGNIATPFTLAVNDNARETSASGTVAVSAFHGSPGAPAVDIVERLAGPLVSNLAFGQYSPYLTLPLDEYFLDVKAAGSSAIIATYLADLTDLNAQAIRVFASGIVGGTPAFGLFAVLPTGEVIELPNTPVARVQIIHNAPSPTVDVYAFGEPFLDDFEFRTATEFFYLPAGVQIPLAIAPGNSTSAADAIVTIPVTFENGKTYVVVASGLVGGTPGFELIVNDAARERAVDPSKIELAVLHGGVDAPAVNLQTYPDAAPVLNNLQYGDFSAYLPIDPDVLLLEIVPNAAPRASVGIWGGDFSGIPGEAATVFASGKLADGSFDLYITLADGLTFPLPSFARVQVIHNSPSPDVDLYVDDQLALPDFEFRTATNVGLFPARTALTLSVAPAGSSSVADAIFSLPITGLETAQSYVIVAAGVVGNATTPFNLYVNANSRFRSLSATNFELNLFHGAPDAPEIDVQLFNGPVIIDNLAFGEFSNYLSVPPSEYFISVTPSNDNTTVVKSYIADAAPLGGQVVTLFASGYLDGAAGPSFGVWVAQGDGETYPLPEYVSTNELNGKLNALRLAPNPADAFLNVQFDLDGSEALLYTVRDIAGRVLQTGDFGTVSGKFNTTLSTASFSAGMYQLEIVSDAGVQVTKFVVQH